MEEISGGAGGVGWVHGASSGHGGLRRVWPSPPASSKGSAAVGYGVERWRATGRHNGELRRDLQGGATMASVGTGVVGSDVQGGLRQAPTRGMWDDAVIRRR
jgi:hypothetical protein